MGDDLERFGASVDEARLVVILLHGRDQDPGYMEEHVVRRVGDSSLAWLAPAAPGRTWYPQRFFSPIEDNQPWLGEADDRLDRLTAELTATGVADERILWCGFSQGACLACHHVGRRPRRWAGLVAFTGGLIGSPGTTFRLDAGFAGMPAYFSTGEADAWVPVDRVHETADAFAAAGARVTVDIVPERDHEVADVELARARPLFNGDIRRWGR
jgi:phospholipase/carboxylesterase